MKLRVRGEERRTNILAHLGHLVCDGFEIAETALLSYGADVDLMDDLVSDFGWRWF